MSAAEALHEAGIAGVPYLPLPRRGVLLEEPFVFIPLLGKVSCLFFNIILAVPRMTDLKLSPGLGPLIPRRLCKIILVQPATRLTASSRSKIRGSRK